VRVSRKRWSLWSIAALVFTFYGIFLVLVSVSVSFCVGNNRVLVQSLWCMYFGLGVRQQVVDRCEVKCTYFWGGLSILAISMQLKPELDFFELGGEE